MRKILLILAAMLLSMGASAQSEIKHRFPQFNYTNSSGVEAYVPAWDIQMYDEGAIPGCVRLQITEIINLDVNNPANNKFKCKIVYRQGILKDNSNFHYTQSGASIRFTDKDGNTVTTKTTGGNNKVKYSDIIDIDTYAEGTWFKGTTYNHSDYDIFNYKTDGKHYVYGDYVIPEKYVNSKYGEFQITDIDLFAFRNNTVDHASESDKTKYWFRPESVTIPATIKSIGFGAFLNNTSTTKVTIASNSDVSVIPARAFMNMASLEEINLPASVTEIDGAALGGCTNLKKIIFEGATAPTTFGTIQWTPSNQPAVTCDWIMANSASFDNLTPANCVISVPLKGAYSYVAVPRVWEFKQLSSPIAFPESKMATCCATLPFTVSEGMTAFYVNASGVHESYVSPTEIAADQILPCGEDGEGDGFILIGTTGTEEIIYPNADATFEPTGNCLVGVTEDTEIQIDEDFNYLVLIDGEFLIVTKKGTLPANKAYLCIGKSTIQFDLSKLAVTLPEETGIVSHETQKVQDNVYYTLQGTQVSQPQKGLVIKNGKKYIVK